MTLFNHKSPTHIRILKEELARAKRILHEGYSADTIWDKMTKDDRKTALYVAEATNPDKFKTALYVAKVYIEQLIDVLWDEIPADIQDLIDLSDFELAKDDREGRNLVSGINTAITNPAGKQFVDKFLKKIGRTSLRDITIKQATQLNLGVGQYIASKNKNPGINVADIDWKDYDGTSNRQDWRGGRIS